ncbi:methyltransferase domain-containing protein [Nitratireductor pacificus]|uniref:Type 11 methyltransferase n=1 Tax=Nitratireductor pacificus pht-3B TaxID=391937 RepID=K2LJ60_9HYPH|nr:methyltransferase domain-containing protein [Nitratireductor pacificus]EKF17759.1 type 11 methyltransferase [Nitratireductor pacificus pht-3B]
MEPLFDIELLMAHKLRALRQGDAGARFLMKRAAADLGERLATVERRFDSAATLFCLTDDAAAVLRASDKVGTVVRVETHPGLIEDGDVLASPETVPLEAASLDLAVSLLTLHETNDTPGLLAQIRRALRPDGLFLGAMAGAGTLHELRQSLLEAETELTEGAAPRVSPFADVRDVGALLQRAGFALPVTDLESVTVRYDTMFDLMRDLRAMGATSALAARSRRPATRALFLRAAEIYAERFADPDGRIRATFNLVWMSGWAPHESQQKPLVPGSAKISLKDVLQKKS